MPKRLLTLLSAVAVGCALIACDPSAQVALALRPSAQANPDSFQRAAYDVTARVAGEYRLEAFTPLENEIGWHSCYMRGGFTLCAKSNNGEIHYSLTDWHRTKLSPLGDSVRTTLTDQLRLQFGHGQVRACEWINPKDMSRAGCLTLADSS